MNTGAHRAWLILLAGAICFFTGVFNESAQQNGVQQASNFTSVEYFDKPFERQMKTRLSGAEAVPEAGGLLVIKQLKLEMFNTNGVVKFIVTAPECVYDVMNREASSAGHLQLRTGDGKIRTEGDGFLWRQNDSSLTISNHVQTMIETENWKLTTP